MVKKIDWLLLILLLVSLLPLYPLLSPGMFKAHDSESHIARLGAFYQSLSDGNLIPRWAGDLNNGFGHPILMFLYPLANYLGSLWHFLGFSFVDSVKLTFAVSFVLSGVFMYLFAQKFVSKSVAFFVALLYLLAPYRFVDLYVRAALGEHVAFTIMPLVLWAFYNLIQKQQLIQVVFASVSLALLLIAHNAIALMFLPFLLIFIFIFPLQLVSKKIIYLSLSIVLGFALACFFWLPAFLEGKYTLRDIVTTNEFAKNFPSLSSFILSPWTFGGSLNFSTQIGLLHWGVVIVSIFYLIRNKISNSMFKLLLLSIVMFFCSLFLMNKESLFIWEKMTILQKFQFPWRFLSLTVLSSSLCGLVISYISPKLQKKLVLSLSFCLILLSIPFWQVNGYLNKTDRYFINEYTGTTDTGESSPRWSTRGMEEKSSENLKVVDGQAAIKKLQRTSNIHEYQVYVKTKTRFVEETVYFPGWEVWANKQKLPIEFQDPNYRGLITFYLEQGDWTIRVVFGETRLRLLANVISLASLIVIFAILGFSLIKAKLFWHEKHI